MEVFDENMKMMERSCHVAGVLLVPTSKCLMSRYLHCLLHDLFYAHLAELFERSWPESYHEGARGILRLCDCTSFEVVATMVPIRVVLY